MLPCVQVLQVTEDMYDVVQPTLRRLVLSCTMDVDTNPMSREGAPNRLMQKLLRENDAIHLVMAIIALPFQKVPELLVPGTILFSRKQVSGRYRKNWHAGNTLNASFVPQGLGVEWFAHRDVGKPRSPLKKIKEILELLYRLMKQVALKGLEPSVEMAVDPRILRIGLESLGPRFVICGAQGPIGERLLALDIRSEAPRIRQR